MSSLIALALPGRSAATTYISGGTYTSNVTWTASGSPYVINGNLIVGASATLTIEPGVIVKMNGTFRTIYVDGRISAVGSAGNRITFTSFRDDIGGDTNGNGPSVGAPGDWYMIHFRNGSSGSQLTYVDVLYGGYGSQNFAYGAVKAGSGATVAMDYARVQYSQRAGLLVGVSSDNPPYAGATVSHSDFLNNGTGIAVNTGWLSLSGNSLIRNNAEDGLWFNFANSYNGLATSIMHSDIRENGRYGVNYNQVGLSATKPYGNWNNIFGNGNTKQLYTLFSHFFVDWTNNYWGDNMVVGDVPCPWATPPEHPWAVINVFSTSDPPDGPISNSV